MCWRSFSPHLLYKSWIDTTCAPAGAWAPPTVRADLLVHALAGVEPGAYRLQDSRIEPLSHGNFREVGRFLCLEQPLGGDGVITCFLMTDLAATTEELGRAVIVPPNSKQE